MEVAKATVRATSSEKLLEVIQDLNTTLYEKLDNAPVTLISVPGNSTVRRILTKADSQQALAPDTKHGRMSNTLAVQL